MHLRGPMNVSQLAVYQLPGEMHTMQKRNTVPFFNRQQSLRKRNAQFKAQVPISEAHQHSLFDEQKRRNSTRAVLPTQNTTYAELDPTCQPTPASTSLEASLSAQGSNPRGRRGVFRRAGSDWSRVAYYTSTAPAQATGFSFLANLGDPQKSGTFD